MSYYPRFVGGAEVAVKEITDRIHESLYEFHLITLRYDRNLARYEKIGNVHVYRIGFSATAPSFADLRKMPLRVNKIIYQVWAPCIAWWLHRKVKFDGVWAMLAHSAGIPAHIFSYLAPVPYIVTLQEGDPLPHIEKQMAVAGPLFFRLFPRARHIVAVSHFLKNWAESLGASAQNISVIPNGVDAVSLGSKSTRSAHYMVVTTSRLVPKNGVDTLICAMQYVPDDVVLHIAGDGYQRECLEQLVTEKKLQNKVIFLGHQNKEQVEHLLERADVFIRPSRSEGFGNSFLEAMAYGVPIVGTHVGGIPDFLIDPSQNYEQATGLVCGVGDPQSIASCIVKYKENPDVYRHIQKNGKELIAKGYLWDTITKAYMKVFDRTF